MNKFTRREILATLGAAGAVALSPVRVFADGAASQGATLVDGRTAGAAMLKDVTGAYDLLPLLSAGDNIPLLTGTWPQLAPHPELTYGIAGEPDGMGLLAVEDGYYLWLQHELVGDKSDEDFEETNFSDTISGKVPGARLSLIKLTKDWRVVGGTQLIREFRPTTWLMQDDGTTPRVAPGSRITIDEAARAYTQDGYIPSDFCGGMLAETGFINPATGKPEPVWFADEENGGYSGVAWACFPDGVAYAVEGLGIYEKETTIALRSYRPQTEKLTILVGSEDDDDSEIHLWIGKPTADDPNGFVTGQLYVMKIAGAARESGPGRLDGEAASDHSVAADGASTIGAVGDSKPCSWVAVPKEATRTRESLADFAGAVDANGARRATAFLATEDLNEDLLTPNRIWLAADGGAGSEAYDDDAPRYENPLSRLYRIDLGIADPADPTTWSTTITYALEGGEGKGVSYDNIAPGSFGQVLLTEDWDQGSDEADAVWTVLKKEQRAPALYLYDQKTGAVQMAFETTQGELDAEIAWPSLNKMIADGKEADARDDSDFWETSGIIEVTGLNANGRSAWLITVQAHSLDTDGYGGGGQVLLARPKA